MGWFGKRVKLTDAAAWAHWYGAENYADKVVTPHSALHVAAAWACIRLLSETAGIMPISVYRRRADGQRETASDHWLYGLVHDDPNADQTSPEFWESRVFDLNGWGNSFAEKVFSGSRIVALQPLDAETTGVRRDDLNRRVYSIKDRGKTYELPEDKVFHLRGFGKSGDLGLSPISFARNSLGIAMAAEEAAGKVFANGLQIGGLIGFKSAFKDGLLEKLESLVEKFVGSKRAGKILALPAEVEFKPVNMNPEDAQLLASRGWSVEEVCRWFRVPPFMIGHTEKSTSWGTGLEQQMIAFLTFAMQPYLTRIEKAIRKQLLTPAERQTYFAEFNVEGLLRADSAARAAFYAVMVNNGIYTRNEVRAKENLPPEAGGDQLTVQSAMVPLDRIGELQSDAEAAMTAMSQGVLSRVREELLKDMKK